VTAAGSKVHLLELLDAIIHIDELLANKSAKTVVFLQQERNRGEWRMENGKWKVESGKWEVGSGEWIRNKG